MNIMRRVCLFALAVAGVLPPCAARAQARVPSPSSPYGSDVRLELTVAGGRAGRSRTIVGELLAVDSSQLWLMVEQHAVTVSRADVVATSVRLHKYGRARAWTIGAIGAILSGLGLTLACARVEGAGCGGLLPGIAGVWLVITFVSAEFMSHNEWQRMPDVSPSRLVTYARYPQGVPSTLIADPYVTAHAREPVLE